MHINEVRAVAIAVERVDGEEGGAPRARDIVTARDQAAVLLLTEEAAGEGLVEVPLGDRAWVLALLIALLGAGGLLAARQRR